MNDLLQPGNVHFQGNSSPFVVLLFPFELSPPPRAGEFLSLFEDDEFVFAAYNGARCFLEICPVNAASVANEAVHEEPQRHVTVPFKERWLFFTCFFRSSVRANVWPQIEPQGISHWQDFPVGTGWAGGGEVFVGGGGIDLGMLAEVRLLRIWPGLVLCSGAEKLTGVKSFMLWASPLRSRELKA